MLYDQNDVERLEKGVERSFPPLPVLRTVYQNIANYLRIAVGSSMLASYDFDLDDFAKTYRLVAYEVYYAIKRLEEAGFLQLNEGFHNPSKLHIRLNYQALYKYRIANAALEPLLDLVLRLHGGELYTSYVTLSESRIASQLASSVSEIAKKLRLLHEQEVVSYSPRRDQPQLLFTTPRFDAAKLPLRASGLEERKQTYSEKIRSVVRYVTHPHRCRTQLLLQYFGEDYQENCGVCDHCREKAKQKNSGGSGQPFEEVKQRVIQVLTDNPVTVEVLTAALPAIDEPALLESLKNMLDSGELHYDRLGRLAKK